MKLPPPTEKAAVETPIVKWAERHGVLCRKMNGLGFNSWPDRAFYFPNGALFMIECKRPGGSKSPEEKLEPGQKEIIDRLRKAGYDIEIHDDPVKAIEALEERLRRYRAAKY